MTHANSPLTTASIQSTDGRRLLWLRILLAVVTLLAFGRLSVADFSNWDDPQTTFENPQLDPPSAEHIAWFWDHSYMDIYAPLTFSIWGILMQNGRLSSPDEMGNLINPWLFHTTNLLLHVAGVLVAFELLRRLTRHTGASAIGALLFGLHPVQVESVGWVSGLKDVLYGFLALVALWQYIAFVQTMQDGQDNADGDEAESGGSPASHYALALIAFILALFSKPTAIVTPLLAFVIDYWLLRRDAKKAILSLWPWFLLAIPFAIIAKLAQPATNASIWPLWSRPLILADALAFYLYKLVYPAHLAPDYGRNPVVFLHSTWKYWTWIVPLALAAGIWALRNKARWLIPAGLLFFICLLPVLGLTPFDFQYYSTVADHYLYLAMLGPALAAALLLRRWWGGAPAIVAGVALAALGVRAAAQTAYWQNTIVLFEHTLAVNPRSGVARERLGAFYNKRGIERSKRVDAINEEIRQLQRSGHAQLAEQLTSELDEAKKLALSDWNAAEHQYKIALRENPRWPVLRLNLSGALANQRKFDEAMEQLKAVIDMQPSLPPGLRGGYEVRWFNAGLAAYKRGDDLAAAENFHRALQLNPGDAVSKRALQIVEHKLQQAAATQASHP